jgi:hypothetical protein
VTFYATFINENNAICSYVFKARNTENALKIARLALGTRSFTLVQA